MPEVNDVISGYRLRSLLQSGTVSQVFEVVEPHSNRHFAMKVLLPEAAERSEVRNNLFHEAEVGQKLRHENVIHIVKITRTKENPNFVMEFFPSGALRSRLMGKDTAFLKTHARKICRQAATALAYMHGSGWVHCDVKPDNFLVNATGQLKVIDFAISKRIPTGLAKLLYRQRKPQGTPSYMAPEQILKQRPDPRADVYGLGATFYETVTGRPPFRGSNIQDLLNKHFTEKPSTPQVFTKGLTDEFAALVLKMLEKKREARPQSCHDVLMTLRKIKVYADDPEEEDVGGMM